MSTSTPTRYGTLTSNTVTNTTNTPINIRWAPNGGLKLTRPQGTQVKILVEKAPDDKGFKWFKISYGNQVNDTGWVREDVINVQSASSIPSPSPPPTAPSEANTQLYFETQDYIIRVFIENGILLSNIYHKASNKTTFNRVVTTRLPQLQTTSASDSATTPAWQSYLAMQSGTTAWIRFIPLAQTELVLSASTEATVTDQESGFSSRGVAYTTPSR